MRKKGEIAYYGESGLLNFNVDKNGLLPDNMTLRGALNGEEVEIYRSESGFYMPVEGAKSPSMISLRSEGCVTPSKVSKSSDERCLSYLLENISLSSNKLYGSGWYDTEGDGNRSWRWMSDRSEIAVYSRTGGVLHLESQPYSGLENPELEILLDGDKVKTSEFDGAERRELTFDIDKGVSNLELKSTNSCRVPSEDKRCLGFRFYQVKIEADSR
jgi:hypothetical protein